MSNATTKQTTCKEDGCERKILARKMCSSHYSQWHRTEGGKLKSYSCTCCGEEYKTSRKPQSELRFCSANCQRVYISRDKKISSRRRQTMVGMGLVMPTESRECANCRREFTTTTKDARYCSRECSDEYMRNLALDSRSPLRKAYEDGTPEQVLDILKESSNITKKGCWEWKRIDASGYPRVKIGGKDFLAHRLSLEMKHGAPLGSQAAHHRCANTKCVNPEHLQPVTHRDNVAEMLARHSYLDRITELENAIRELSPGHEVLNRIPIQ